MRLTPLALLLLACGGPDANSEDCPLDAQPGLELGVGSDSFSTLDEAGGEAVLVHGAQGGYHLELGLRATGLDASDLATAVLTGVVGSEQLASNSTFVQFRCNAETGTLDAWNLRLIYDAQPEALADQPTTVRASVTDGSGAEFTTESTLTIVDPSLR